MTEHSWEEVPKLQGRRLWRCRRCGAEVLSWGRPASDDDFRTVVDCDEERVRQVMES